MAVPTVTPPKFRLVVLKVRIGWAVVAAPVPLRATAMIADDELLEIETAPVAAPASVGAKLTCRVVVCPGHNVNGRAGVAMENPAPVTVKALTVTVALPVDCSVMD